jgi:hypothetical protein
MNAKDRFPMEFYEVRFAFRVDEAVTVHAEAEDSFLCVACLNENVDAVLIKLARASDLFSLDLTGLRYPMHMHQTDTIIWTPITEKPSTFRFCASEH